MIARSPRASAYDVVAGAVLVIAGLVALIVRLGVLNTSAIPVGLLHWWPLSLIIVGLVLWYAHMDDCARRANRRMSGVKHGL